MKMRKKWKSFSFKTKSKKQLPLNQRYKSCRCSSAAAAAPAAAAADGPEAIGAPINATTKNTCLKKMHIMWLFFMCVTKYDVLMWKFHEISINCIQECIYMWHLPLWLACTMQLCLESKCINYFHPKKSHIKKPTQTYEKLKLNRWDQTKIKPSLA